MNAHQNPIDTARVALVTGGTDGIGRAVALRLARGGDRVLFVGRDEARGQAVLAELQRIRPDLAHGFIRADLALLSETARVAEELRRRSDRLDALVCCAGILSTLPEWTSENLERNFVLNYLTRYLLVRRLLPLLHASPSGRVVLVSNAGKYGDTLDLDDLQHRRGRAGLAVSGRTQFANDLLATELAARVQGTRVAVSCVFPGVAKTNVFRNARGVPRVLRAIAGLMQRLFGISAEVAADTPSWLAQHPTAAEHNGRFYGPRRKQLAVPARALREDRRSGLWTTSEDLVQPYLD
jgi:NAD(P)-dependent dehydrogenase (short-subunit alcohol dehydrogenase family)